MLMQSVVRLSDRFLDPKNPEAIDRQEKLVSCVILVSIFYATLSIGFVKLGELERKHRFSNPDPNVTFELMIAPPEPKLVQIVPPAPSFYDGNQATGGSHAAAAQDSAMKIPSLHVEDTPTSTKPPTAQAHRLDSRVETPIAIASTNKIIAATPSAPAAPNTIPAATPTNSNESTTGSTATAGIGLETHGSGNGGTGAGTGGEVGDGNQSGINGGPQIAIDTTNNDGIARGNIAPYRKRMLINVAQNWRPSKKTEQAVVLVRIAHDGKVLDRQVISAANNRAIKNALAAIDTTEFEPLPDWYRGEEITFKLTLDALELQN